MFCFVEDEVASTCENGIGWVFDDIVVSVDDDSMFLLWARETFPVEEDNFFIVYEYAYL